MVNKGQYLIKVADFEGPMDLLYQLIMNMELDIYNISIADVANQYLLYVQTMNEMELDNASEYLVIAAKLLVLKSKRLLPSMKLSFAEEDPLSVDDEDGDLDELVHQLLEYRKFLEVFPHFRKLEKIRSYLHEKEACVFDEDDVYEIETPVYLPESLVQAFEKILTRRNLKEPLVRTFMKQEQTVSNRMAEIIAKLRNGTKSSLALSVLCENHTRTQMVTTFLSILELLKKREITVWQVSYLSEIYIKLETEK